MTLSVVCYERLVAVRLRARYNAFFSGDRVLKFMAAIYLGPKRRINTFALEWDE